MAKGKEKTETAIGAWDKRAEMRTVKRAHHSQHP